MDWIELLIEHNIHYDKENQVCFQSNVGGIVCYAD